MEILVILVVALLVLGPTKLPEAARSIGKAMAEFRRLSSGFESEVRDAFAAPATTAEPTGTPAVIEPSVHPPTPPATDTSVALPTHPADAELPRPAGDPNLS